MREVEFTKSADDGHVNDSWAEQIARDTQEAQEASPSLSESEQQMIKDFLERYYGQHYPMALESFDNLIEDAETIWEWIHEGKLIGFKGGEILTAKEAEPIATIMRTIKTSRKYEEYLASRNRQNERAA